MLHYRCFCCYGRDLLHHCYCPEDTFRETGRCRTCYGCHGPIKTLHAGSKHGKLNCAECHSGLEAHLKEITKKPGTNLALINCGRCHKEQYESAVAVNLESTPKVEKATTTLKCHPKWTEREAEYQIEAIQNYIRGKMRKAEFWISEFVRTYIRAKDLGVPEEVLKESRKYHTKAHTKWEWWTAENSDGFHNPDQAKASLLESIQISTDGVKFLEKAMEDRLKAGK